MVGDLGSYYLSSNLNTRGIWQNHVSRKCHWELNFDGW